MSQSSLTRHVQQLCRLAKELQTDQERRDLHRTRSSRQNLFKCGQAFLLCKLFLIDKSFQELSQRWHGQCLHVGVVSDRKARTMALVCFRILAWAKMDREGKPPTSMRDLLVWGATNSSQRASSETEVNQTVATERTIDPLSREVRHSCSRGVVRVDLEHEG